MAHTVNTSTSTSAARFRARTGTGVLRYRQVALVEVFIQMLLFYAVLFILIFVKSLCFTASFNKIFLFTTLKNDWEKLESETCVIVLRNCRFDITYNVIR